ncbi:polysaccharide biosynthesis/export family protein [Christiangramia forsetii]|uniref:Polysaccharide export protein n=2 Tax=Christiangramia forsetii TaxID=411153 RepID=A0M2V4_CHRFK|nr:polysaccharide biosynthesis/export family protein [Christiangramia forsetii]GGG44692.1 polysaccharide biosynthesis protein [Christiangramia forsetii]CAL66949.1 polysaccharide export protein [Christiangramia forsetii KT0803]
MKKLFGLFVLALFFTSCATKDEIVYFYEGKESLEGQKNLLNYEPKIEKNDVLRINVSSSSINEEIVEPFQMKTGGQQSGGGGGQNSSLTGYLVSPDGMINFPVLGEIKVEGLTRTEIQKKLEREIEVYVKDPIVDVRIMNFRVTVLGEVGSPGRVEIQDGRISMPELIAMSGDITYDGRRENITIIREENGIKKIGHLDMTKTNLFQSPYFYLKQNDIVYVEPSYRRVKSAGFFSSYQGIISIGTTLISLYLLVNSL